MALLVILRLHGYQQRQLSIAVKLIPRTRDHGESPPGIILESSATTNKRITISGTLLCGFTFADTFGAGRQH
jgi:hypothetical protein